MIGRRPRGRRSSRGSRVTSASNASGPPSGEPEARSGRGPRAPRRVDAQAVTGAGAVFGSSSAGSRYVRRSSAGAATATPGRPRSRRGSPRARPVGPNASTRRSARPTRSRTVRSIEAVIPASVASEAYRTPIPSAIPTIDRSVRPRRAARGCGARARSPTAAHGAQSPSSARRLTSGAGVVVLAPAEGDLVADPAVADHEDAVGVGGGLRVVGHEDDRLVALDA